MGGDEWEGARGCPLGSFRARSMSAAPPKAEDIEFDEFGRATARGIERRCARSLPGTSADIEVKASRIAAAIAVS